MSYASMIICRIYFEFSTDFNTQECLNYMITCRKIKKVFGNKLDLGNMISSI